MTEPHPRRIQRLRAKGWRMPPGTVYVGRPGPFGNPFGDSPHGVYANPIQVWFRVNVADNAAEAYELWLAGKIIQAETNKSLLMAREVILRLMHSLRGKNLACWCPLDRPCHADVLLKLANAALSLNDTEENG